MNITKVGTLMRQRVLPLVVGVAAVLACAFISVGSAQSNSSIVIAQTVDATSLDPAFRDNTRTGNVILHIFDPIVMRTADMGLEPWLADSIEQTSPTAWTINLKKGITFSNGEPLDAQAVKFSLDRILDPATQAPTRRWFTNFTDIKVIDDYTLAITTDGVDPLFKVRLTFLYPVPPKYFAKVGASQFSIHPIGTGPYELVDWVRDDHITLKARDDYWAGRPSIQNVTFRIVPEEVARVSALETGEADLIESISPDQADYLKGVKGVRVESAPSTRAVVLSFDTNVPPADNLKFREAVAHAINPDVLIKGLYRGYAEPLQSFFSPAIPGWPKDKDYTYNYDPALSRKLLSELDLGKTKVVLRSSTAYPIFRNLALALASQLQDVGLNVDVTSEEWSSWFEDLKAKKMSAIYLNDHGNVWIDPYPQLQAFFDSNGFLSTYSNPEFDKVLAASNDLKGQARVDQFGKALTILKDDVAGVPLLSQVSIYGVRDNVQWKPRPDGVIRAWEMHLVSGNSN